MDDLKKLDLNCITDTPFIFLACIYFLSVFVEMMLVAQLSISATELDIPISTLLLIAAVITVMTAGSLAKRNRFNIRKFRRFSVYAFGFNQSISTFFHCKGIIFAFLKIVIISLFLDRPFIFLLIFLFFSFINGNDNETLLFGDSASTRSDDEDQKANKVKFSNMSKKKTKKTREKGKTDTNNTEDDPLPDHEFVKNWFNFGGCQTILGNIDMANVKESDYITVNPDSGKVEGFRYSSNFKDTDLVFTGNPIKDFPKGSLTLVASLLEDHSDDLSVDIKNGELVIEWN